MSNGCDGCPLKDDPNACKTMCARDHKREMIEKENNY